MARKIVTILTRRGNSADFDESEMLAGEIATVEDAEQAYISFADGTAEELALKRDINNTDDNVEIPGSLPNPHALIFTGAVSASYDGSEVVTVNIPVGEGGDDPGNPLNVIEVVDAISDAVGDVVYITGEEPDGNLADILEGYQRARDKLQAVFINTDDGIDGNISSDSTLLKTPNCNILVDIGRKSDYNTVKTALLSAGVTRLDYIFLSHYHHDHCGCLSGLTDADASNTSLSMLWDDVDVDTDNCVLILPYLSSVSDLKAGERTEVSNVMGSVNAFVTAYNVTTQIPAEGYYWNTSNAVHGELPVWEQTRPKKGISVRAHNCSAEAHSRYDTGSSDYNTYTYNNFSTVLEIEHGHTLLTLTGDINVPAQTALTGVLRQCDVYKVPHHAYETAIHEDLLVGIQPRFMVVNADADIAEARIKSLDNATALWSHNNKVPLYLLCDSGTCVFESDGTKYELLTNNREYRQTFAERDWTRISGVNLAATAVANAFVTKVYPELINADEVRFVTPNCNIGVMRDGINTINRCHYYFHNAANSTYDYHFDCYVNWSTGEVGLRQNLKATNASLMVISDLLYR